MTNVPRANEPPIPPNADPTSLLDQVTRYHSGEAGSNPASISFKNPVTQVTVFVAGMPKTSPLAGTSNRVFDQVRVEFCPQLAGWYTVSWTDAAGAGGCGHVYLRPSEIDEEESYATFDNDPVSPGSDVVVTLHLCDKFDNPIRITTPANEWTLIRNRIGGKRKTHTAVTFRDTVRATIAIPSSGIATDTGYDGFIFENQTRDITTRQFNVKVCGNIDRGLLGITQVLDTCWALAAQHVFFKSLALHCNLNQHNPDLFFHEPHYLDLVHQCNVTIQGDPYFVSKITSGGAGYGVQALMYLGEKYMPGNHQIHFLSDPDEVWAVALNQPLLTNLVYLNSRGNKTKLKTYVNGQTPITQESLFGTDVPNHAAVIRGQSNNNTYLLTNTWGPTSDEIVISRNALGIDWEVYYITFSPVSVDELAAGHFGGPSLDNGWTATELKANSLSPKKCHRLISPPQGDPKGMLHGSHLTPQEFETKRSVYMKDSFGTHPPYDEHNFGLWTQ